MSLSDALSLRLLSPDARAASPRKNLVCGTGAWRLCHTLKYIRRAPQARASDRDGVCGVDMNGAAQAERGRAASRPACVSKV